jgi:hypothetical protein
MFVINCSKCKCFLNVPFSLTGNFEGGDQQNFENTFTVKVSNIRENREHFKVSSQCQLQTAIHVSLWFLRNRTLLGNRLFAISPNIIFADACLWLILVCVNAPLRGLFPWQETVLRISTKKLKICLQLVLVTWERLDNFLKSIFTAINQLLFVHHSDIHKYKPFW